MSKPKNRTYSCPWCGYDPESWFIRVYGVKPDPEEPLPDFVESAVVTGITDTGRRIRICSVCRGPRPYRCDKEHGERPCNTCGRVKRRKEPKPKKSKTKRKKRSRPASRSR